MFYFSFFFKIKDDTPLHRAFYKNNIPMISLLLKKGADIRKANKSGMKPGDYAQTEEARAIRELALGGKRGFCFVCF